MEHIKNLTARLCALILLVFIGSCSRGKVANVQMSPGNVFSRLDFDRAVAYDYNGEEDEIINAEGKLAPSVSKQVQLTAPQVAQITNILCDEASYGGPVMMCFLPRLGIVFYKGNVPKAHVSICLECNYARSSIKIPQATDGFSSAGKSSISGFQSDAGL